MTVGQLIEALGKFDKDLHVTLFVDKPEFGVCTSADCIDPENIFINRLGNLTIKGVEEE